MVGVRARLTPNSQGLGVIDLKEFPGVILSLGALCLPWTTVSVPAFRRTRKGRHRSLPLAIRKRSCLFRVDLGARRGCLQQE